MALEFEDGLTERILNDAGAEPGNLPLLEFALAELWGRQRGRTVTHSAYEQIGQLSGALAQRAEKVFRSLTSAQQDVVLYILIRLVHYGGRGLRAHAPEGSFGRTVQ